MKKIKLLIVDDSVVIRELYKSLLSTEQDIEIVDTAIDPYDAREKIKRLNPDVITLDIEMPKMDGLSFLEKIMALRPMPVIMASTLTQKGASATIRALEIGAVDYVSKPLGEHTDDILENLKQDLISKIHTAAAANIKAHSRAQATKPSVHNFNPVGFCKKIIAIGSSTGGVEALRDIFLTLPANCPPIVMAQHMPEQFTGSFAARLDSLSEVSVCEAKDGLKLQPGHAYLAPGGKHLVVIKKGNEFFCKINDDDKVSGHKPSVDVLFRSIAETVGADAIGIILTGMGKDGAEGMLKMHGNGAYTIGQSQASCVVYGMPKAAASLGAVDIELPLNEIAKHMLKYAENDRRASHAS